MIKSRQGGIVALDNINLVIENGSVFGLLGPNGAGKTTLLKTLATLILPDCGTAVLNGYDLIHQSEQCRSSVGLVSGDERSFYWRLTGRANLEFFGRLNNLSSSRLTQRITEVAGLLTMTGLDRRVGEYSAGMRQKLNLARALLADPSILLIDEPTKSLDIETSERLRRFIKDELASRQGKTVLITTHNLGEAEALCQQVAVLRQGKIVRIGTVESVKPVMIEQ